MNTRKIEATDTWSPEIGNVTLDTLVLKDFHHYFFDGGSGLVSYCLKNSASDLEYFNANIQIPSTTLEQWGASDDIIFNYVATQLGLTIINN
jgi:hypothetical protein